MKAVVFGLTVSSSFGNGHATLWRGLCRALRDQGHRVVFFERDVPYYAEHRDPVEALACELVLYRSFDEVLARAEAELLDCDAGMVTSYCPDALAAAELVALAPLRVFYDLDTPITLDRLRAEQGVSYVGARGLADYDLVLSFTGGESLDELRERLGAKRLAPLYGSVDPDAHRPVPPAAEYAADLSYLGTYAADRQDAVDELFFEPARRLSGRRFVLGGSLYPDHGIDWPSNVFFVWHVAPERHPAFYCSSPLTLNVTRAAMARNGYCPSGRLFEAAACGVPVVSDRWPGIERFFEPGREILLVDGRSDVIAAVESEHALLDRIGRAARQRVLEEHTAERRARELADLLGSMPAAHGPTEEPPSRCEDPWYGARGA